MKLLSSVWEIEKFLSQTWTSDLETHPVVYLYLSFVYSSVLPRMSGSWGTISSWTEATTFSTLVRVFFDVSLLLAMSATVLPRLIGRSQAGILAVRLRCSRIVRHSWFVAGLLSFMSDSFRKAMAEALLDMSSSNNAATVGDAGLIWPRSLWIKDTADAALFARMVPQPFFSVLDEDPLVRLRAILAMSFFLFAIYVWPRWSDFELRPLLLFLTKDVGLQGWSWLAMAAWESLVPPAVMCLVMIQSSLSVFALGLAPAVVLVPTTVLMVLLFLCMFLGDWEVSASNNSSGSNNGSSSSTGAPSFAVIPPFQVIVDAERPGQSVPVDGTAASAGSASTSPPTAAMGDLLSGPPLAPALDGLAGILLDADIYGPSPFSSIRNSTLQDLWQILAMDASHMKRLTRKQLGNLVRILTVALTSLQKEAGIRREKDDPQGRLQRSSSASDELGACFICLDDVEIARDWTRMMPCGHRLCTPCFRRAVVDKSQCPLCRHPVLCVERSVLQSVA